MDSDRIDTLAKALASRLSRRRATAGLLALMGIGVARIAAPTATAKKKKRTKKKKKKQGGSTGPRCPQPANPNFCASTGTCLPACPSILVFAAASCDCVCPAGQTCECQFEDTEDNGAILRTLQGSCTTTETIVIDNGVTLDGNNKTITMAGPVSGFQSVDVGSVTGGSETVRAGLLIQDGSGSVRDLTIDQGPLDCDAAQAQSAIVMLASSGDIASVTIENTNTNSNIDCYRGIELAASSQNIRFIDLSQITISGIRRAGVTYRGNIAGTIDGNSTVDGHFAINVFGPLPPTDDNHVNIAGISVNGNIGINVGGDSANVTVQGNTINGPTGESNLHGVLFQSASPGSGNLPPISVSGNTISNFNCGVTVQNENADVEIENNTITPAVGGKEFCP